MQQVFSDLKLLIVDNEIIIDDLQSRSEDFIQKGINEKDYIQLFKQHILSKNKNEIVIFNHLLNNKDKQQNMVLLAKFYRYGIGTEKNRVKAFECYKAAADKGQADS